MCLTNIQSQHKIYVSTKGNDANLGTKTTPLATLIGARNSIRKLKKNKTFQEQGVIVIISDGEYSMKEPLVLLPEDSGTAEYPIIYKAEEGATPVFSGGKKITGFYENEKGLWETKISESLYYKWKFDQLYVNNKRAVLAKTPNNGFIKIDSVSQNIWKQGSSRIAEYAQQIISLKEDGFDLLSKIKSEEIKNVRFKAYHKWDYTLRHINDIDANSKKIVTSGRGMKPWNPLKNDRRLVLENFEAALDAPGEWFLKDNGTLLYRPLEGQMIGSTEVIAPALENLISIIGNEKNNKPVEYITIQGLSFKNCHYKIPSTGAEPNQAAAKLNAAIMFENAKDISIINCEISLIGQHAIWLGKGCHNSLIEHNYIHNIGGGGVYLGDFKPLKDDLHTHHITVNNNIIKSGGQEFPPAVGIWVGHSSDNNISHNDIGNFYYSGISVGWVWGYKLSLAKRNTIAYNHIHHIGWDLLSDMAGIYTLGDSEGTIVENNVIHHVHAYSYGGWGMYADEGSSGIFFKNNLVYNTKTGGFQQNYGKGNTVKNNILAFAKKYQLQCTVAEEHKSFSFTNNIILFNEGVVLKGAWDEVVADIEHNIYWNTNGNDYDFNGHTFKAWQNRGFDKHSFIINPNFKNSFKTDFRFENQKSISKINFVPFDYSKAGVIGDKEWKKKAKLSNLIIENFEYAVMNNMILDPERG
ncbi:right-handed parallel beta-helix repeat-containing protein [Pseudalgibacter alginicilyticus]|uniref:right-handed parallel beta-helix repeat-containing protein n=1 Tax=Pseudalgibacter alginicilyticus TaxID=1736674 RepID=UPI000B0361D0|nr:right-handed parallel beta-helix repeat-containing protein [Pseudalgibacter alginicilyticus]